MNRTFLSALVVAFTLSLGAAPAVAEYEDTREIKESKAKGQLRAIRKKFADIDKELAKENSRNLNGMRFFDSRYKAIDRALAKVPDKDPSWDLSKEQAYYEALKKRVTTAVAGAIKAAMESKEPDPDANPPKPFRGAPEMKAEKPDWCDAAPFKEEDSWMSGRAYDDIVTKPESKQLLRAAEHACRAPEFDKRQKWSRNWRQMVANQTGADAKLISRLFALTLKEGREAPLAEATCKAHGEIKKRAGQAAPTKDQEAFAEARALVLGCKGKPAFGGDSYAGDLDYWVDRAAEPPSEMVRVALILTQLGFSYSEGDLRQERDLGEKILNRMRNYTIVSTDIDRLDEAKLQKEIEALKLNEFGRVMAELSFARAKHLGRVYVSYLKEMSPAIQVLALKTPKEGFADWEKGYAANKAGMDLYVEVEKKLVTGAHTSIKGCHDKAHAAFVKYVNDATKGLKDPEDKKRVMRDAIGSTLLKASMICASYEGQPGVAATLYNNGLNELRGWRGPRLAGYWAMIDKFAELKSADSSLPLDGDRLKLFLFGSGKAPQYLAYENTFNKTGFTQSETGQVQSAKKTKGGVKLTFKTVKWKETIWDCKETNRIDRINADGTIVYRTKCKAKGQKTVSSTVKPYLVPAAFAAGLKKGQFVTAAVENGKGGRVGVPLEVYKSKKKEKLVGTLGAKL